MNRDRVSTLYHRLLGAVLLVPIVALGCSGDDRPADEHEHWINADPGQWPRIAMVNRIRYSDSNHPMAGSAFLLDTGNDIVAVTAKHVLRYFKSEAMDTVSFRGTLVSWEMFPKDEPDDVTVVDTLINENAQEPLEEIRAAKDWLLFTVKRPSESVTPLRLRTTPLESGETVYVVGWRYTDEGRQHVYRGSYVRSEKGSVLINVKELADNTVPGLSGAPVIDAGGHVIGTMSSKSGRLQRLASVDYPRTVLKQAPRPAADSGNSARPTDATADCAQRMTEHFEQRGWVGITPAVSAENVVSVEDVVTGSPADTAGVQRGDIIHGINGVPHDGDPAAFESAYDSFRPGVTVVFDLERDGDLLSVDVRLAPVPEAVLEEWIRRECP